jgi:lysine-N-methylase
MNADSTCPLLLADGLCRVHSELGEDYLSHMCSTYPRVPYSVHGETEKALALSCPEAARLVLLNPHLPISGGLQDTQTAPCDTEAGSDPWRPHFFAIRDFALRLVRSRTYPLWQRMFLLGLFSRRLDDIAPADLDQKAPQLLADFAATLASDRLLPAMEALPVDPTQQLDVVLRLAVLLHNRVNYRPRFVECLQAFTEGIGNDPGSTLESLTARYLEVHDRYYAPFIHAHPHILENYLINAIFRCRFPFGIEWARNGSVPSMSREFVQLTAQFTLMKGLLIGVAGYHREQFSVDDVVLTIQAASKHFDHHLDFLKDAHALLVESGMDGARGLGVMLRNGDSLPRPTAHPVNQAESRSIDPAADAAVTFDDLAVPPVRAKEYHTSTGPAQ